MRYSRAKLKKARQQMYNDLDGLCQVCGVHIPESIVEPWNFPHFWGKNKMDEREIMTAFTLTCKDFHSWEHTLGKHFEKSNCVQTFLTKYGKPQKRFWENFCEVNGIPYR